MAANAIFESRTGNLTCSPEEVYNFVTDIRNFKQFVPKDLISDWSAEKESGSFRVSSVGGVNFRLGDTKPYSRVLFSGEALSSTGFTLDLLIEEDANRPARVKVILEADMNPVLKMMVAAPAARFLETLIEQMERFRDWTGVIKDTQSL